MTKITLDQNMKNETRYTKMFEDLAAKKSCAFIPFLMMGDPDFDTSLQVIDALVKNGADALVLSMPFSEPVADGPAIQNATLRAFKAQMNVKRCFEMLGIIRQKYPQLPIGLQLYSNLLCAHGLEDFYAQCAKIGVDNVLVVDVPVREFLPFYEAAQKGYMAATLICPLAPTQDVVAGIAKYSNGAACAYTYLPPNLDAMGDAGKQQLTQTLALLKCADLTLIAIPMLQGAEAVTQMPAQIKALRALGVQGVMVGTGVVQLVENHLGNNQKTLDAIKQYAIEIKAACVG